LETRREPTHCLVPREFRSRRRAARKVTLHLPVEPAVLPPLDAPPLGIGLDELRQRIEHRTRASRAPALRQIRHSARYRGGERKSREALAVVPDHVVRPVSVEKAPLAF